MEKGDVFTSRELLITQDFINRFAEFSGDFNPIHVNEEFAKKAGLGGTIAHGVIMLQYLTELLEEKFGENFSFGVKFVKPARPGDTVFAKITIEDTCSGIRFKAAVEDTSGETHVAGEGTAGTR
ncbi:MAG: MaoC family dehydratase [bacterium]